MYQIYGTFTLHKNGDNNPIFCYQRIGNKKGNVIQFYFVGVYLKLVIALCSK